MRIMPLARLNRNTSFILELNNGQNWAITADSDARDWAETMADLLELERGQAGAGPTLSFRKKRGPAFSAESSGENPVWIKYEFNETVLSLHPDLPECICEVGDNPPSMLGIWESLYPVYRQVRQKGGLPMHSAFLQRDGKGILIAGVSNSGKSTCCRRIPPPWEVLCDEEILIVPDKKKGRYWAHPFPTWSLLTEERNRLSWNVRRAVPIDAVFFLEKAEADAVFPLGRGRTAMNLSSLAAEKCHIDWDILEKKERVAERKQLFENACRLAESVPAYLLKASLYGNFWEKIEEVI
jgi:SynChlorMet cassette protein ScmC